MYAHKKKVERGHSLRVDTTVVESNIHYPIDARLLWDSIRVLTRLMEKCRQISPVISFAFAKRTRRSKKLCYKIVMAKGPKAKQVRQKHYRGLLKVAPGAVGSKSNVVCDALVLDEDSATDTFPYIEIEEDQVDIGHEATVSKVSEEQLFYLRSRGIDEEQAASMIVSGFIEPIVKELPMEYALEMNRLVELEMEGSVG